MIGSSFFSSPLLSAWRAAFDEAVSGLPVIGPLLAPRWRVVLIDPERLRRGEATAGERGHGPVVARLAGGLGMRVPLKLPRAARGDLASAAQLELQANSPIALGYAYAAIDTANVQADGDKLALTAEVADRDTANAAADLAMRVAGRVDAVDVERPGARDAAPAVDIRSGGPAMRRGGSPAMLVVGLSAVGLIVGLAGFAVATWAEQSAAANAPGHAPAVRAALELADKRRANPPMLETIDALSGSLPRSAYLESLEITGSTVKIAGQAQDAARLPGALEADPLLSGVAFSGPTRGLDSGRQAFEITLTRTGSGR